MFFQSAIHHFVKEVTAIKGAPFLSVVLLAIGFGIAAWLYRKRIVVLERQVFNFRQRLGLFPRSVATQKLNNGQLRDAVSELVAKLRAFDARFFDEGQRLINRQAKINLAALTDVQRTQSLARFYADVSALSTKQQQEFGAKLRADASNAYEQMMSRLPEGELRNSAALDDLVMALSTLDGGPLAGPHPLATLAAYLEVLSQRLP